MKQIEELLQHNRTKLVRYLELLERWQAAVNLVSKSTLPDAWNRHVRDSAQLFPYIPARAETIIDMGSGAGFPGMVLAVLNQNRDNPLQKITLIESDSKKCLFLKEVARQLEVPVDILNCRLEYCPSMTADVITARGLASVNQLLVWAKPFMKPETMCLFLKGEKVDAELKDNQAKGIIERIPSITHDGGCVLKVTEVY